MHQESKPTFLKIKAAAIATGLSYRVLLDAVNDGTVPHHRLGRSRRLVRINEILDAMERISTTEVRHD